jgi:cytochrome c oxidase subunit IV
MAQDEKESVRDEGEADAKDTASKQEESKATDAEGKSADKHEAERSAAEAHVEAKEQTEEAVGVKKSAPAPDKVVHTDAHGHGGHHKPNRKEYMVIFAVLAALTVLEVAVAQIPGISKSLLTIALVGLAVTKAAFVGLFYMHLKHETRILKMTVAIPMSAPALYALVLIADAAWRLTR